MNANEELARLRKAVRLADLLDAMEIDEVPGDYAEFWRLAGTLAGTTPPSESTRELVGELLRDRAAMRAVVRARAVSA